MPLMTSIERDGEPVVTRWGWWHVEMMLAAVELKNLFDWGVETRVMTYEWGVCDPTDHEELWLRPGDELMMWRSSR